MLTIVVLWCGVAFSQNPENGEVLAGLGGCSSCHTVLEDRPYGGGHPIVTTFGTYYGSNISPDEETGIGAWTEEEFILAMRRGKSPTTGRPYVPDFPYPAYTGFSDADLRDLFAYLMTQEPVYRDNEAHDVPWLYKSRLGVGWWRVRGFQRGPFEEDPSQTTSWNRGAYLSNVVGHCGECHTPRTKFGVVKRSEHLAGGTVSPARGPNITPHPDALADWSASDWNDFLEMGMTPDGNFVGGEMGRIVEYGTARLSGDDRAAMAEYLMSIPPLSLRK